MPMAAAEKGTLDLSFTRVVPLAPLLVWQAWTKPEHLVRWFTPAPWRTLEAEVDLRPGGIFRTVMQGPAGEHFDNVGCWLEVVPHQRLVWTDALEPGWRPSAKPFVSVILTLDAVAEGTRYTARVLHKDAADRDRHAAMGFQEGWGKALDQLVELMRGQPG
jgi:uncharacterized protein YndB with AHSA1/START domain